MIPPPNVVSPFDLTPAVDERFMSSLTLDMVVLSNFNSFNKGEQWCLTMVLICIPLMINDTELIFHVLLPSSVKSHSNTLLEFCGTY